jgi:hypothetical protein
MARRSRSGIGAQSSPITPGASEGAGSAAHGQAQGQRSWQSGGHNPALGELDVVGHAAVREEALCAVPDGVGGARIAVARLADGAGIDQ